jgi:hypothetical protein
LREGVPEAANHHGGGWRSLGTDEPFRILG